VLLGDAANITDNKPFVTNAVNTNPILNHPPRQMTVGYLRRIIRRSLQTATALAAASRVMKGYNDTLSAQCLQIAQQVWQNNKTLTQCEGCLSYRVIHHHKR
jgi:endoglucanase